MIHKVKQYLVSSEHQIQPFERHHAIPRCMGGLNLPENIVNLTPREHIHAHLLLAKIHPQHFGLITAATLMSANLTSSKVASQLRERFIEMLKSTMRRKYKSGERVHHMLGKQHTPETKTKLKDSWNSNQFSDPLILKKHRKLNSKIN